ncbi:MAG: hypothetical protein JJE47_00280 [Acidimicrobiia bacterium]|nr:hypothetical protein [Acidimicrobiia bacterium]
MDNLDPDADPVANLDALADGFHAAIGADRAAGCPSDYGSENLGPDAFVLGGARGVFYGYVGMLLPDGQPSELNLQYVTIVGSQIISITAIAYDEGACPGRDGESTWDSPTLSKFRPYLDAALHDSPLPSK